MVARQLALYCWAYFCVQKSGEAVSDAWSIAENNEGYIGLMYCEVLVKDPEASMA
jgi:hypothetical protein